MADGMFSGIDTRSQAEILNERARARAREFEQLIPRDAPLSYQSFMRAGGLLRNVLQKKFGGGDQLPQSQQTQVDAVASAKERFNSYKKSNPDLTIEDQGLEWQRVLSEELLSRGDPQGAQLAAQYAAQADARRRAELEIQNLEGQIENRAFTLRKANWDFDREQTLVKRGERAVIWEPGTDDYLSIGKTAFINDAGEAVLNDRTIPLGSYSTHPPQRPNSSTSLYNLGINTKEAADLRNRVGYVNRQMDGAKRLRQVLRDNVSETGTVNFMSRGGAVMGWATSMIDDMSSIARSVGGGLSLIDGTGEGKNLTRPGDAVTYIQENPDLAEQLDGLVPANIRSDTRARERWQAAMVQMAYAAGMAAEPGGRQLSDADFKNAIIRLAGATSDPEAFRMVMLENITSEIDDINFRLKLWDPDITARVVSKAGYDKFIANYDDFLANFGTSFGEAGRPGPGLTSEPGGPVLQFNPETGQVE